jgi:peptide/nickel transport system substrate-binding protein
VRIKDYATGAEGLSGNLAKAWVTKEA